MVCRKIIIFILISNLGFANIIYDKNDITITDLEYEEYIKIHNENYGEVPNKNFAIKNLVLIKKTINQINENNAEYLENIDISLENQYGNNIYKSQIQLDVLRFMKIRNEFISNFYLNEFDTNDLNNIFLSFDKMVLPISQNQCLIIDELKDLKNDNFFIDNFYFNLKNNSRNFQTKIDKKLYDVCINEKDFKVIEGLIIQYIDKKIDNNFNKFIYKNIN